MYAYDRQNGRHVWRPGKFNQVRVRSMFKGDAPLQPHVPAPEDPYGMSSPGTFPAGALARALREAVQGAGVDCGGPVTGMLGDRR